MRKLVLVTMLVLAIGLAAVGPAQASCVAPPGGADENFVCCDVMVNGRWADPRCEGTDGSSVVLNESPVDQGGGIAFPIMAALAGIAVIGAGLVAVAFMYRRADRTPGKPGTDAA